VHGSFIDDGVDGGDLNSWRYHALQHNAARRHRIGKMKFKVTNWTEYEAGLRRRGSLTLWITPEALSSWQAPKRTTRGGSLYSDLAIETALTLGVAFGRRRRQREGMLASVLKLMGLDLTVPDHTTLSRGARTLAIGEQANMSWRSESGTSSYPHRQHGARGSWRRPVAGGEARGQIPTALAQIAPGAGCRHRLNHRSHHD
jgi:hypothetical protein